jgi:hypothetical protein
MIRTKFVVAAFVIGAALTTTWAKEKSVPHDAAWVDQRVKDYQPTAEEKRFDEIGWAKDIREAERLAKENNRPIMLFTHDGRMNIGRC